MELIPSEITDLGMLRRILYASVYLPKDLPEYWSVIAAFANAETTAKISPDIIKTMVENPQLQNPTYTDKVMMKEIHMLCSSSSQPIFSRKSLMQLLKSEYCSKCENTDVRIPGTLLCVWHYFGYSVHRLEHEDNLYNRIKLDQRRFEAAHFRYAVLSTPNSIFTVVEFCLNCMQVFTHLRSEPAQDS